MSGSDLGFRVMALAFRVRDALYSRAKILAEVGIEAGFRVLDYGCGPGSYVAPLAGLVGASGKIYALDKEQAAIKAVRKIMAREGIKNVETILSDCNTGLPDQSIDVVLLYDIFHHLPRPGDVLGELSRVLKPNGILSVSDHHMQEQDILQWVPQTGHFTFSKKGRKTYTFRKTS